MPYVATELIESRASDRPEGGPNSTVRVYLVDGPPDQVSLVGAVNLPALNDPLPWDTAQVCYSIRPVRQTNLVSSSTVTVLYSNAPPHWGGSNPSDPNFKSWTLSYYRVAQPIPYAVRDTRTSRWTGPGGTTNFVTTYPVAYASYWESRSKFIRRVRVQNFAASGWEPIGDLSNKLVKIYSRWYLFTLSDVVEVSRNNWDASYSFELDMGTPDNFQNIDPNMTWPFGFTSTVYGGLTTYARPPFTEIRLIPGYDAANNLPAWPIFKPVLPYVINQNGHTNLPGFGPL